MARWPRLLQPPWRARRLRAQGWVDAGDSRSAAWPRPSGLRGLGRTMCAVLRGAPRAPGVLGRQTAQVLQGRGRAGAGPALSCPRPARGCRMGFGHLMGRGRSWAPPGPSSQLHARLLRTRRPRRGARARSLLRAGSLLPMGPGSPDDTDSRSWGHGPFHGEARSPMGTPPLIRRSNTPDTALEPFGGHGSPGPTKPLC